VIRGKPHESAKLWSDRDASDTLRTRRAVTTPRDLVAVAPPVARALRHREPVVALETTLVAHGFPPGEGVAVGIESERRVREAGAVPATIGVLDGRIHIGLTEEELGRFGPDARKVGPRDLATCAVQGAVGATTVGGTLAACRVAGIGFLGTGGLGGVHRGFPSPPDVSADVGELARTEALVVSSGVKSILDVPATAEVLETLSIPVLGFATDELPLFYSARGGPRVSARVESAEEAARIARAHWALGRHSALLLARPPDESLEDVEPLIEEALAIARNRGVTGQEVTPFVLSYLHDASGGRTLAANRELVAGNAALAAEVAVAFARLA
jgi:pseudouridine-5'-phosphate glycosidase